VTISYFSFVNLVGQRALILVFLAVIPIQNFKNADKIEITHQKSVRQLARIVHFSFHLISNEI
jgi:hypothetical protein